jgi:hypothetical protein
LKSYLRQFATFDGDVDYDFNGAFHLFLALLDNLTRNHNDADLEALEVFRPWFTEEQQGFLKKLERLK